MNAHQFKRAIALVESGQAPSWAKYDGDHAVIGLEQFDGCALPGAAPVVCTIEEVSSLLSFQALMLNGEWDYHELDNCRELAKRQFQIVGDAHQDSIDERRRLREIVRLRSQAEQPPEPAPVTIEQQPVPPSVTGPCRRLRTLSAR